MTRILLCLLAAGLGLIRGPVFAGPEAVAAGTLFLVLGLGHGAIDHEVERPRAPGFYVSYALAAAAFALLWALVPAAGLTLFLALSALHLGQGEAWPSPSVTRWLAQGSLWVVLPFFAHPELSWPILDTLGAPGTGAWLDRLRPVALGMAVAVALSTSPPRQWLRVAAIAAPMITLHPVIGFAIPFSLLHGFDHLRRMQLHLQDPTLFRTWLRSLPLSGIAAASGLALFAAFAATGLSVEGPVGGRVIFFIGALTLPHGWWVERLRRIAERTAASGRNQRPQPSGRNDFEPRASDLRVDSCSRC